MLSAFAWHFWDELDTDWEAGEHLERARTKQAFAQEEAMALAPIDAQPEPMRAAARAKVLRALVARRPMKAHCRQRDEAGWWSALPTEAVLRKPRKVRSIAADRNKALQKQ